MSLKLFPTVIINLLADYLDDVQDKAILYYYVYTNYSTITKVGKNLRKLLENGDDQYWVVLISIINRDLFRNTTVSVIPTSTPKHIPLTIKHIQSGRIDNYSASRDYEASLEYEDRDNTTIVTEKKKIKTNKRRKHNWRGKKSVILENRFNKLDGLIYEFDEGFDYHECLQDGCCGFYYDTFFDDEY